MTSLKGLRTQVWVDDPNFDQSFRLKGRFARRSSDPTVVRAAFVCFSIASMASWWGHVDTVYKWFWTLPKKDDDLNQIIGKVSRFIVTVDMRFFHSLEDSHVCLLLDVIKLIMEEIEPNSVCDFKIFLGSGRKVTRNSPVFALSR